METVPLFRTAVIVLSSATLSGLATAQTIAGTTTGLFSNGSSSNLDGLSYTANTGGFNVLTATDGSFAIGGSNNNHLGQFQIASNSDFTYTGNSFTLRVAFTAPSGVGAQSFVAALTGQVTSTGGGGASINFSPTPSIFAVPGGRTLSFWVNSMSLTPTSGVVALTGRGVLSPVPEPASVAALGIGALGLLRRKRARSA